MSKLTLRRILRRLKTNRILNLEALLTKHIIHSGQLSKHFSSA